MALFDAIVMVPILTTVRSQVLIRDQSGVPISRADFAFEDLRYAIYCDGRKWRLKEDRWEVDLQQRNKLAENGWIFSVFSGSQILRDAASCAAQIAETYMRRLDPDAWARAKATKKNAHEEAEEKEGVSQKRYDGRGNEVGKNEDRLVANPTRSNQDGRF
jgi:very-short-patch-repair endonuclease